MKGWINGSLQAVYCFLVQLYYSTVKFKTGKGNLQKKL